MVFMSAAGSQQTAKIVAKDAAGNAVWIGTTTFTMSSTGTPTVTFYTDATYVTPTTTYN